MVKTNTILLIGAAAAALLILPKYNEAVAAAHSNSQPAPDLLGWIKQQYL